MSTQTAATFTVPLPLIAPGVARDSSHCMAARCVLALPERGVLP